jgi:hypothetical protein
METPPRYLPDHASAFSDATPGWCPRLKEGVRRRVRKSGQKEPPVAADAGLLQIGWGERFVEVVGVVKVRGRSRRAKAKWRLKQSYLGHEEGVFANAKGHPITSCYVRRDILHPIRERLGIPRGWFSRFSGRS